MKYIIMLLIVVGAALTDFLTGYIKAYGLGTVNSRKMRIGGLNKVCEIFIMGASIGLNIGLDQLGLYYQSQQLMKHLHASYKLRIVFFKITILCILHEIADFPAFELHINNALIDTYISCSKLRK